VLYDAVYVPGGAKSVSALTAPFPGIPYGMPITFLRSAYRHYKAIAVSSQAIELLKMAEVPYGNCGDLCAGVFVGSNANSASTLGMDLAAALLMGRFEQRTILDPPSLYMI
jgi:catalase